MVNQVETHVFQQQQTAHAIMQKYGVTHQSWGPFAEGRNGFFTNGVLNEVAAKYNKFGSTGCPALFNSVRRGCYTQIRTQRPHGTEL